MEASSSASLTSCWTDGPTIGAQLDQEAKEASGLPEGQSTTWG